jgi:adenylate kinase
LQAAMLEQLAARQGHRITSILIYVPSELLTKRMTGRRNCPVCGEIYNIYFKPPKVDAVCDFHPATQLVHRADDAPDKIKVRLSTYEKETTPLIDYYEGTKRLYRIDGTRETEDIYREVERVLALT